LTAIVAIGKHALGDELRAALDVHVDRERCELPNLIALKQHGEVVPVLLAARRKARVARAFAENRKA